MVTFLLLRCCVLLKRVCWTNFSIHVLALSSNFKVTEVKNYIWLLVYTNFRPVQPLALNQDYHKIFRTVFIYVINKTSVFVYFFEKLTLFIVSHINPPHTHTHSSAPSNRFLYFIKPQNTTLYIYIPNLKWNSDKPNAAVYVRHTYQTALQQQKNKSGWRTRLKRWVTAVTIWVRSPIVTKEFFFSTREVRTKHCSLP